MNAPAPLELPLSNCLEERFMAFHLRQPTVYLRLREMALRWKGHGHRHGSIKMFWEALRFQTGIERDTHEEYRLNNDYHAHYARLLMSQEPELRGFFETRQRKGGADHEA